MIDAAANLMVDHVLFGIRGRIPAFIPVIPRPPADA
jgi:hypothetical protein